MDAELKNGGIEVSTHSRPKAAGIVQTINKRQIKKFQHTAARRRLAYICLQCTPTEAVSTHSRPKAAGRHPCHVLTVFQCFNTQPPEGGWLINLLQQLKEQQFQHTAARRRLGRGTAWRNDDGSGFNTQPPEGGWLFLNPFDISVSGFNTQPPEGGWEYIYPRYTITVEFQHTAARRRLEFIENKT